MDNGNKIDHKNILHNISFILIAVGIVLIWLIPKLDEDETPPKKEKNEYVRTPSLPKTKQPIDQYDPNDSEKDMRYGQKDYDRKMDECVHWKVSKPDGFINGHGYVDLGLPSSLKWATSNIGASSAEEYGDYFAWGETKVQKTYKAQNCSTYGKDSLWLIENKFITKEGNLTPTYDAASQNWGDSWRMPTSMEIKELLDHTYPYWVTGDEIKGLLLENKDGKNIFLPAQGNIYESTLYSAGIHGYYWASTIDNSNTELTYYFYFINSGYDIFSLTRNNGFAIRPVSE